MSDPAGPVQFSLGDLGGPFGKFSDHSERWTKRTTKTAWSSPEAIMSANGPNPRVVNDRKNSIPTLMGSRPRTTGKSMPDPTAQAQGFVSGHVLTIAQAEAGLRHFSVGSGLPGPNQLAPPLPGMPLSPKSVLVKGEPHLSISWNRRHVNFR